MMYIVYRSNNDYLAHHGIKGQKWGVRRFQNPDGSLTSEGRKHYEVAEGGSGSMSRKFNREIKKLNKLRDRSDVNIQQEKAAQYDRRAKTGLKVAGVGAAIAGAGAAAEYGGANLRSKLVKNAIEVSKNHEWNAHDINSKQYTDDWTFWDNRRKSLNGKEIGDWNTIYSNRQQKSWETYKNNEDSISAHGIAERNSIKSKANLASQIHKGVMAAGAAVAIVGGGMAAYNKIQSSLAKRRMSDVGHDKAVAKYKEQVDKMREMFKDTPYSHLLKKAG